MISFFAALWLSISAFLGFVPEMDIIYEESIPTQTVPTGTPLQSAPPLAITACITKALEEECSFTLQSDEISWVCKLSGDEVACSPNFEE